MTFAQDRQQWRQAIHKGKSYIKEIISQKYQHDHNLRHGFPDASATIIFCVNCERGFTFQIGLFSHQRAKHVIDETLHWCHHRTRWTARRRYNSARSLSPPCIFCHILACRYSGPQPGPHRTLLVRSPAHTTPQQTIQSSQRGS